MLEKLQGFILQAWEEGCHPDFSCCSPGKLKDHLPGLEFDLVFVSEMRCLNYAKDSPM